MSFLQRETNEGVQLATEIGEATLWMRRQEYTALVLDQAMADADPNGVATLLQHAGSAVPIYVNLAISGVERVLSEVRMALRRRQAERMIAHKTATAELRDELRGAVTGILLSSELALSEPTLPHSAQDKIQEVYQLAQGMRRHLEM